MFDSQTLIDKIIHKQLPLSKSELAYIKDQIKNNKNIIQLDGINNNLRSDWINTSLPSIDRATKNISTSSQEWRKLLEYECEKSMEYYIEHAPAHFFIYGILIWRAGLAYLPAYKNHHIEPIHVRLKRDETDLSIKTYMNFNNEDMKRIKEYTSTQFIITDPMLGSGNSVATIIDILLSHGHLQKEIQVLNIVSCPEGLFRLTTQYPEIKIITNVIDGQMNKDGYIINAGLGDCGDKYFYENSIENFDQYKKYFTSEQWSYLTSLLT